MDDAGVGASRRAEMERRSAEGATVSGGGVCWTETREDE
jgi:hypothetical protein